MAKLLYQGHGSYRITSNDGHVIYVDPFAGNGYDKPADLILITHEHYDHVDTGLVTPADDCRTIRSADALKGGAHNSFDLGWVNIDSTWAENANHDPKECVGYVIKLDGVSVYGAGDTSYYDAMADMPKLNLDYALLPADGIYNMGLDEAAKCAAVIGAKHNIVIHMVPPTEDDRNKYDLAKAESWTAPNKLIVQPGEEIEL
ncbi:MAG: MBL fold metallo-hydrolase [Coriobacteriales bacterium]|jgi:L-ascorbate metabolism protein UlaG (beta-lactamase superfamily)|nr:MBL fold metallo-hydrolase [Coriobacteriales bacterium]